MTQPCDVATEIDNGVSGILVRGKQVLLVHRSNGRLWAPNCWDAPGGHVEAGEADVEALMRELDEELAITIVASDLHLFARLRGPSFDVRVFVIDRWTGEPINAAPDEHDDIRWFDSAEVADLRLADPDLAEIISAVTAQVVRGSE